MKFSESSPKWFWGFPGDSAVKNLPAVQEMWVRSLGWEDPKEKGTATHSSILAWWIPWTEEPAGLQSMGSQRISHDLATKQPPPSDSNVNSMLKSTCIQANP